MEELQAFIQSNPDPRELKRALAVKLALQDYSYFQIRDLLNVSLGFITKWKQAFIRQGVEGLKLGYKGAKSYLDADQKQKVLEWLQTKNCWDLEELESHLEQVYGVVFKSKQSYYALFKEAGISRRKTQKTHVKHPPTVGQHETMHSSSVHIISTGKLTKSLVALNLAEAYLRREDI